MSRPPRSPLPSVVPASSPSTAEVPSPSPTSPPPLGFNDLRARFERGTSSPSALTQTHKGATTGPSHRSSTSRLPSIGAQEGHLSREVSPQVGVQDGSKKGGSAVTILPKEDGEAISAALSADERQTQIHLAASTAETPLPSSERLTPHQDRHGHRLTPQSSSRNHTQSERLETESPQGRIGLTPSPAPSGGSDAEASSSHRARRPPPPRPPKHSIADQPSRAASTVPSDAEVEANSPQRSMSALRSRFESLQRNGTARPPEPNTTATKSHNVAGVSSRVPPPALELHRRTPPLSGSSHTSDLPSGLTAALEWADAASEASSPSVKLPSPRSASLPQVLSSPSADMRVPPAREAERHTKLDPPPLRRREHSAQSELATGKQTPRVAAPAPTPSRPPQRIVSTGGRAVPPFKPQANEPHTYELPTARKSRPPSNGKRGAFAPPLLRSASHPSSKSTRAPALSNSDSGSESENDTAAPITGPAMLSVKINGTAKDLSVYSPSADIGLAEVLPDTSRANRRPPAFAPPRYAQSKHFQCFAAWGHTIAAASGDKVRIYRVGLTAKQSDGGDKLCSLAAEHGGKDVKVTAMAFRPSGGDETDGRYLWCGTREGTLCEMDIVRATVQSSKHNLHTAPVVILHRVGNGMLSMDESGKICIWLPQGSPENHGTLSLSQSPFAQRVTLEKSTVVLALGAQLWACSGSLVAHGVSRAQQGQNLASAASAKVAAVGFGTSPNRGPSPASTSITSKGGHKIRIFEPFSTTRPFNATSRPIGLGAYGNAGIGAITSGTTIPEWPDRVYLGHDSGHVSIWDKKTLSCIGVQRLSILGFTAICGVSNLLWTGNRSGRITIYAPPLDPTAGIEGSRQRTAWKVVKSWPAHKGSISSIALDPASLDSKYSDDGVAGMSVVSAGVDHSVHFWDGLLSSDWLEQQVSLRIDEFSTYRSLRSLHVTFNIDAASPSDLHASADSLEWLPRLLKSAISADGSEGPGIIYFGFQEVVDLEDKRLTAKSMLLNATVKKGKADSERVSHQYRMWYDRLVQSVRLAMPADCPYRVVHFQSMVGLFSCVFIRANESDKLSDEAVVTVKTGLGGRWGNKGSIVSRFLIDDTSCTFINAHLAAGQRHVKQRNDDLAQIFEAESLPAGTRGDGVYVDGGSGELILDHELVFFGGDLNYRIDLPRSQVLSCIQSGRLDTLLVKDQLHQELERNSPLFRLRGFQEAESPTNFAPTYKFDPGTQKYDTSDKGRVPAWCDRLLYRSASQWQSGYDGDGREDLARRKKAAENHEASSRHGLRCLEYRSWPEVTISDHRPVSAIYEFQVKRIEWEVREAVKREEEVNAEQRRARLVSKTLRYYEEAGWRWSSK